MGFIYLDNCKILSGMYGNEYISGPVVITPFKLELNVGLRYVGVQSIAIRGCEHENKPRLRFWLLDHAEIDDIIIKNDDTEYDDITKLGYEIATIVACRIGCIHGSIGEKFTEILERNKKFAQEMNTISPYKTLEDVFIKEYSEFHNMYIKDDIIDNIIHDTDYKTINKMVGRLTAVLN